MAYPQQDRGDTFAQDRDGSPSYGKQEPSYGKQPDGYFQYVNVPAHKEYEFGWNRGNPHHYISRYEQSKEHRFRTRVSKASQITQFCRSGIFSDLSTSIYFAIDDNLILKQTILKLSIFKGPLGRQARRLRRAVLGVQPRPTERPRGAAQV
jgi:hypothetical protein